MILSKKENILKEIIASQNILMVATRKLTTVQPNISNTAESVKKLVEKKVIEYYPFFENVLQKDYYRYFTSLLATQLKSKTVNVRSNFL